MSLDIRILEVLVSRICHDLISPISAVGNGAELVADMGGVAAGVDDAFDLIRSSAVAASVKLQAFRLAYGAGGSEWHVSLGDVEKAFGDYIGLEHRYRMEWNISNKDLPQPLPRGLPKLTMLVLMWAMECLPKGGVVKINNITEDRGPLTLSVFADGSGALLREGMAEAFSGSAPVETLTPKTVHAAATGAYAAAYNVDLKFTVAATDSVQFILKTNS